MAAAGFGGALTAFAAAAAAMVILAFGAAAVVAWARLGVAERIEAGTATVKRWGGVVLVAVGLWLVALGVFAEAFARLFPV